MALCKAESISQRKSKSQAESISLRTYMSNDYGDTNPFGEKHFAAKTRNTLKRQHAKTHELVFITSYTNQPMAKWRKPSYEHTSGPPYQRP